MLYFASRVQRFTPITTRYLGEEELYRLYTPSEAVQGISKNHGLGHSISGSGGPHDWGKLYRADWNHGTLWPTAHMHQLSEDKCFLNFDDDAQAETALVELMEACPEFRGDLLRSIYGDLEETKKRDAAAWSALTDSVSPSFAAVLEDINQALDRSTQLSDEAYKTRIPDESLIAQAEEVFAELCSCAWLPGYEKEFAKIALILARRWVSSEGELVNDELPKSFDKFAKDYLTKADKWDGFVVCGKHYIHASRAIIGASWVGNFVDFYETLIAGKLPVAKEKSDWLSDPADNPFDDLRPVGFGGFKVLSREKLAQRGYEEFGYTVDSPSYERLGTLIALASSQHGQALNFCTS